MYKYALIGLYILAIIILFYSGTQSHHKDMYQILIENNIWMETKYTTGYDGAIVMVICMISYIKNWRVLGIISHTLVSLMAYSYITDMNSLSELYRNPATTQQYNYAVEIMNSITAVWQEFYFFLLLLILIVPLYVIPIFYGFYCNSLLGLWIQNKKKQLREEIDK